MEFDRPRIKEMAKSILHEAQPRPWKVTLVFQLLLYGLPLALGLLVLFPTFILLQSRPASAAAVGGLTVLLLALYLLFFVLMVLFMAGYIFYTLRLWRREPASYRDLFRGFSMFPRLLALFGLILLFSLLWYLPLFPLLEGFLLLAQALRSHALLKLFPLPLLGYGAFWISRILRYTMAFHVLLDHPEYTARQALNGSKALMMGQRWRLTLFFLSFLGWFLLIPVIVYAVAIGGTLLLSLLPAVHSVPSATTLAVLCILLLSWAASAPLTLWLSGYMGVSLAGVYDRLQGAPQVPSVPPWQPPAGEGSDL